MTGLIQTAIVILLRHALPLRFKSSKRRSGRKPYPPEGGFLMSATAELAEPTPLVIDRLLCQRRFPQKLGPRGGHRAHQPDQRNQRAVLLGRFGLGPEGQTFQKGARTGYADEGVPCRECNALHLYRLHQILPAGRMEDRRRPALHQQVLLGLGQGHHRGDPRQPTKNPLNGNRSSPDVPCPQIHTKLRSSRRFTFRPSPFSAWSLTTEARILWGAAKNRRERPQGKAHGAQQARPIMKIGEPASTAQRRHAAAQ